MASVGAGSAAGGGGSSSENEDFFRSAEAALQEAPDHNSLTALLQLNDPSFKKEMVGDEAVLKPTYKKMQLRLHPDKNPPATRKKATQLFQQLAPFYKAALEAGDQPPRKKPRTTAKQSGGTSKFPAAFDSFSQWPFLFGSDLFQLPSIEQHRDESTNCRRAGPEPLAALSLARYVWADYRRANTQCGFHQGGGDEERTGGQPVLPTPRRSGHRSGFGSGLDRRPLGHRALWEPGRHCRRHEQVRHRKRGHVRARRQAAEHGVVAPSVLRDSFPLQEHRPRRCGLELYPHHLRNRISFRGLRGQDGAGCE
ncbi:unnamed protein product [Amoebophrya sp. A120]|nr:unnamed protein product [Amoebophrya sp. A120]|eukprot:GSA120T00003024001.1